MQKQLQIITKATTPSTLQSNWKSRLKKTINLLVVGNFPFNLYQFAEAANKFALF